MPSLKILDDTWRQKCPTVQYMLEDNKTNKSTHLLFSKDSVHIT